MKVQGYHLDILEFSDLDGLSVHMSSESSHGQWSVHEHSAIRRKLHEYAAMSKRGAVHQWYYEEWIISINDEKIKEPATVLPVRTSMDKLVWITEVEARIARPTKSLSTINAWCVCPSDSNVKTKCNAFVWLHSEEWCLFWASENAQCNGVCQCISPSSYNGQSCTQTPITCNSNSV